MRHFAYIRVRPKRAWLDLSAIATDKHRPTKSKVILLNSQSIKMTVQALPLITNKRWLTWFCVCPLEESEGKFKKILCIIFSSIVFAFNVCALIASIAFFLQYVSSNLEKSLYVINIASEFKQHPIQKYILIFI